MLASLPHRPGPRPEDRHPAAARSRAGEASDDLVFHRDALEALRQLVVAQKTKTPKLNVVAFKDLTGVTRKYAIPLLEYLDRERVTKRVGDERVIL